MEPFIFVPGQGVNEAATPSNDKKIGVRDTLENNFEYTSATALSIQRKAYPYTLFFL